MKISTIFLAGGKGLRMGSDIPKQYLLLSGKPIARYSFDLLLPFGEMIVVAAEEYLHHFPERGVIFADPGLRRQDSVHSGLEKATGDFILIHDGVRPFIQPQDIHTLLKHAFEVGAATLASPVKLTIKEADTSGHVSQTLDRSKLWEIHTPQAIRRDLLEKGFEKARLNNLTVTDDVSLAELISSPVKLVACSDQNLKITTPQDLAWAEFQCSAINSP